MFESFWGVILGLKSKRVTCSKLRIYELADSELCAINYEFTNWRIDDLRVLRYWFELFTMDFKI